MRLPPTAIVAKAVLELGGPSIEEADIEWASHIPAGQQIVQWLADQCVVPESGVASAGESFGLDLSVALQNIALENEELQILKCTSAEGAWIEEDHNRDTIHAPLTYVPPSHLRKHATNLDAETRLLDTETAKLKSRLRQTKQASQHAVQTISSLEVAIEREDAAIARIQECLAELSVLADTTLSSGTNTALALLDTLAPPQRQESKHHEAFPDPAPHSSLASVTQSLTRLASLRSTLAEQYTSRIAQLTLEAPEELLNDSGDLSRGFEALLHHHLGDDPGPLREAAYAIELRRMYEALCQTGSIPDLDLEGDGEDVDVKASLEKAWTLDQAAALDAEHVVLDSAIQVHHDTLLPELRALHSRLSSWERLVRAAEAWVGAFGIEVEGVVDAGRNAHSAGNANADHAAASKEHQLDFERELKDLLLQHHNEHHGVDEAPLVLLDKSDILTELRRIHKAVDEGDRDGWKDVSRLRETLGSLNATHRSLLSVLYGTRKVQTNASPPFGRSAGTEELEQRTQEAVTRLEKGVGHGEELEHTLGGKRTQRKLGEFVDRWVGGSK